MKCVFARGNGKFLIPADDDAVKFVESLKVGDGVVVEAKRHRNLAFHRKFFSLLRLAFDMWEPVGDREINGIPVRKDFERFREDITILAGYYDASYGLDGTVKLRAKSISFANCDQDEFESVYNAVLDVVWDKILKQAKFESKEEVERVVCQLLEYG